MCIRGSSQNLVGATARSDCLEFVGFRAPCSNFLRTCLELSTIASIRWERMTSRFKLAPGTQVREEDFGLLFYTMKGPRLYFFPSGDLMDCRFFEGKTSLDEWVLVRKAEGVEKVSKALLELREKGIIVEC